MVELVNMIYFCQKIWFVDAAFSFLHMIQTAGLKLDLSHPLQEPDHGIGYFAVYQSQFMLMVLFHFVWLFPPRDLILYSRGWGTLFWDMRESCSSPWISGYLIILIEHICWRIGTTECGWTLNLNLRFTHTLYNFLSDTVS